MPLSRFSSVFLLSCLFVSTATANPPQDVRALIQKWVETERMISQEDQAWQENRAAMTDVLIALEKEEKILSDKIRTTKNLGVQADKERAGLLQERGSYQKTSGLLHQKIADYERQVAKLLISLPPLLQKELEPLALKLRSDEELSLSMRTRTVVSIINQIEKFDNSITLDKDIRKITPDREVEVDIFYLGLAQGFYVDRNTQYAGWGEITPEGWIWQAKNELAADIRTAIDVYEGRKSPVLVELPLSVDITGEK